MKPFQRLLSGILAIGIVIFFSACAMTSSTAEPEPYPTMVPEPADGQIYQYLLYQTDSQGYIRRMKGILDEKKYYVSTIPDSDKKSDFFDSNTLLAVNDCCQRNGLPFSDSGVIQSAYDAIMSGNIVSRDEQPVTPPPEPLAPIYPKSSGLNITQIQQKLIELKYDQLGGPYQLNPGVYDEQMYKMVGSYAKSNNYQMDGQAISPELQYMILNDNEPYEPMPEPTSPPGIKSFFLKPVSLFGLMVPRFAQWLVCLALIGIIAALIVFFFAPDSNKKDTPMVLSRDSEVEFEIEYQGRRNDYQCSIGPALQIGRNVGRFPLDMSDKEISRNHCEIYRNGVALMLKDHSTYGTKINGQPCHNREQLLHSGDQLDIGAHVITIRFRGVQ